MRLTDLHLLRADGFDEVSATLTWEDRERAKARIHFRSATPLHGAPEDYADSLLIAAALPAMVLGEQRIRIDHPVCPVLLQNLPEAMAWIDRWFGLRQGAPLHIEAQATPAARHVVGEKQVASCFSGGVDSWATLCINRAHVPPSHPAAIRKGILIWGLQGDVDEAAYGHALRTYRAISGDIGIEVLAVETNIYSHWMDLDLTYQLWRHAFNAAALTAVGHLYGQQICRLVIPSSDDRFPLGPWGTHPLLDPLYSSHALTVVHDSISVLRQGKIELLSEWPVALAHLRVCDSAAPAGQLNCGHCEKCVRTMLMLTAIGKLEQCPAFPSRHLDRALLVSRGNMAEMSTYPDEYLDLVPLLRERGRDDLVDGIKVLTRRWRKTDLRGWLKRFDQALLRGSLQRRGEARRIQRRANAREARTVLNRTAQVVSRVFQDV